jgi:hypothetical protein
LYCVRMMLIEYEGYFGNIGDIFLFFMLIHKSNYIYNKNISGFFGLHIPMTILFIVYLGLEMF